MGEGYFDQGVALEQADAKRLGAAEYAKLVRGQGRTDIVKNYYQRAIEKWQITAQKLSPSSDFAARAWYFIGVVYYQHLGDAERALPYCQKFVETWPDHEYAWSAQALLVSCYEHLVRSGKVEQEEAEPKIERACKVTLEKYPDCFFAKRAYLALGKMSLQRQRWDEAAQYYTKFLELYPKTDEWKSVMVLLGATYERRGQTETAAELYRTYLDGADPTDHRAMLVQNKLATMQKKGAQTK